jgi:hypothetical protein
MRIRPLEAELFHAGGQTDMMKLTVAFRNIANAPKYYQKPVKYSRPQVEFKPRTLRNTKHEC